MIVSENARFVPADQEHSVRAAGATTRVMAPLSSIMVLVICMSVRIDQNNPQNPGLEGYILIF